MNGLVFLLQTLSSFTSKAAVILKTIELSSVEYEYEIYQTILYDALAVQ